MALSIISGILTANDGGAYNWDDVVTAGGTDIQLIDGVYHVDIEISVTSGTLLITERNIVFSRPISTSDSGSGVIDFGELATDEFGKQYTALGCALVFNCTTAIMGGYAITQPLYERTDSRVNFYGTSVIFDVSNFRGSFGVSDCINSSFSRSSRSGTQRLIIYQQTAGINRDCVFTGLHRLNLNGALAEFSSPEFVRCTTSIGVREADNVIHLSGAKMHDSEASFWLLTSATNAGIRFIDSQVDLKHCSLFNPNQKRYNAVSVNYEVVDQNGPVQDALVMLASNISTSHANTKFSHVSDANGALPEIIADIESAQNDTPLVTTDHSAYHFGVISFEHLSLSENLTLNKKLGCSPAAPERIVLVLDSDIVMTEAEAVALTSINTVSEAYNRFKAEYRASEGQMPIISIDCNQLYTNGVEVILDPAAATAFSFNGTAFVFKTNRFFGGIDGDVTLMNGSTIEGGNYGRVTLDSGFTYNITFTDITFTELVNNTAQDVFTNVVNTANAPRPCLEAQ